MQRLNCQSEIRNEIFRKKKTTDVNNPKSEAASRKSLTAIETLNVRHTAEVSSYRPIENYILKSSAAIANTDVENM